MSNNFVRNTGDDGLAMWSETTANAGNTFDHNTVQTPTLANGIAIYGGTDTTVVEQPRRRPDPRGQRHPRRLPVRRRAVHRAPLDHRQHHGPRRHLRAELEHRARRDLVLRARARTSTRTSRWSATTSSTAPTTRSCWSRDWPVKDLYSITERRTSRTSGSTAPAPRWSAPASPGRPRSRTSTPATSARSASTTAGRSTSRPPGSEFSLDRPRRQRRRRHDRPVARAVGAAEHDHLRRPAAGRGAPGAVAVVMAR